MKKLLFTIAIIASAFIAAADPVVNQKVMQAFTTTFPGVENAKWYEMETFYEAYFEKDGITCRVRFDRDGKIKRTIRYYGEEKLCPFLRAKLSQKFPGKKVFGVTELNSDSELSYNVILEDAKTWTHVKCDGTGTMDVTDKFRKS